MARTHAGLLIRRSEGAYCTSAIAFINASVFFAILRAYRLGGLHEIRFINFVELHAASLHLR